MATTNTAGATSQDKHWKPKGQSEEARYTHEKEQAQLAAIRAQSDKASGGERDIEGGFGGQEDLEDRYATTSGEH